MADRRLQPVNDPMPVSALELLDEAPHPDETLTVSPRLIEQMRRAMGLSPQETLPSLDEFFAAHVLLGSTEDLEWLYSAISPGEEPAMLTLAQIRQTLIGIEQERNAATTRYLEVLAQLQHAPKVAPTITLQQAAACFYRAVYPEVRERLNIAIEQLGQPLERILLGVLSHHRDDLHGVDMSLVPTDLPQSASGNGVPEPGAPLSYPPRACPVCAQHFIPRPNRPNQHYCGEACGQFAHMTDTWAINAARTPEMQSLPWPKPLEAGLAPATSDAALSWQTARIPHALEEESRHQEKTTGVRRSAPRV